MNAPPPPPTTVQRADDDVDLGPSKSQRKRDMHALQDLGERLVDLPPTQLAKLALAQDLVDAIELARRITAREGRRRQLQYVGKLMRRVDADEIRARLDVDDVHHRLETAVMHAAERWRDALIETPERLAEFVEKHPAATALGLHTLLRGARHEHEKGVHGRHFRDLYRALRDVLLADAMPNDAKAASNDA